jgi:hypothetical protein
VSVQRSVARSLLQEVEALRVEAGSPWLGGGVGLAHCSLALVLVLTRGAGGGVGVELEWGKQSKAKQSTAQAGQSD